MKKPIDEERYNRSKIFRGIKIKGKEYHQVAVTHTKADGIAIAKQWRNLGYNAKCIATTDSYNTHFGREKAYIVWARRD